jgi:hypothetical protein
MPITTIEVIILRRGGADASILKIGAFAPSILRIDRRGNHGGLKIGYSPQASWHNDSSIAAFGYGPPAGSIRFLPLMARHDISSFQAS